MGLLLDQTGRVNLTGIRDPAQAERLLLLESIATVLAVPDLGSPPSGTVVAPALGRRHWRRHSGDTISDRLPAPLSHTARSNAQEGGVLAASRANACP